MKNETLKPLNLASVSAFWPVASIALLTWISILAFLDPAGSYPRMPQGPGLTIDELFNVEQGVYLVEMTRGLGWLNLVPGSSQDAYQIKHGYNPDHPPLGRWWLGLHHHLAYWLFPPNDPDLPFVTACARTGSATAFALTVLLIGAMATIWSGRSAGVMTAISLSLMPRVYGHAHLASLETITNLTCTASVLAVAGLWKGPAPPSRRVSVLSGVLLGLAFLTKIQAIFIPIPVICWAIWQWRIKALLPLVFWAAAGFIVFYAGWPYLWSDPAVHLNEYLGRATHRASLQVWYFAQKFADKNVPWHYPFVMFALTVPATLHVLGLMGLFCKLNATTIGPKEQLEQKLAKTRDHHDCLLLACILLPLIVFAMPGVAVYDCERLFLTSFPLWAIFVGRGWIGLWQNLVRFTRSPRIATTVSGTVLAFVATPLVSMAPCHLCYYNSVFQLWPSAIESVGLEVDYWGVGITRELLQKTVESVPVNSQIAIVPTLHPFQADDYRRQSPILRHHGIKTVENRESTNPLRFALVYHRRADLPPAFQAQPDPGETIEITKRGGVWLAYLTRLNR